MMIIRSTSEVARNGCVSDDAAAATGMAVAVPEPDSLELRATYAFADEIAAGRVPTIRTIRSRMRIGQPRAQQVRAHLRGVLDASSTAAVSDERAA